MVNLYRDIRFIISSIMSVLFGILSLLDFIRIIAVGHPENLVYFGHLAFGLIIMQYFYNDAIEHYDPDRTLS